jgi:membrane protein YdbS with pleckstrin-like domain
VTNGSARAAEWIYGGIWAWIVAWFRVPRDAPTLPDHVPGTLRRFHPALSFLRYLKLFFWVALAAVDGVIVIAWLAVAAASPITSLVLLAPALVIAVVPDIVVYIALHLRYDTTWYVMSSRSLRIRRGIWTLREMTITFENVQNIKITQGPVMRLFGIKNVVVETAGSAGHSAESGRTAENQAVLEGVDNADEIRDLILARVRASRSAGLGDEHAEYASSREPISAGGGFTATQIGLLREIRDEAALLAR